MSWLTTARRPVSAVAAALGWEGDDRRGYPCPACREERRDARRGAVYVGREGAWHCYRCNVGGDGLDYLSYALTGARLRDAPDKTTVRTFTEGAGWTVAAPITVRHRPPPPTDIATFWASCGPVPADPFTTPRRLVAGPELARYTPLDGAFPEWWPRGRASTWRLVTRGYDASHRVVSLHGRAVVTPPVFDGKQGPKTLWAKGIPAENVVFWNGVYPDQARLTVVAEGITDWLSFAVAVGARPIAVYGATSGGFGALASIPVTTDVVVATDEDEAGDAYASEILDLLGHLRVLRARPSRLAESLSAQAAK